MTEAQRSVHLWFSNGTPLDFELIAADVNGDLAYTVGYERCSVSVHGGPAKPVFLRATRDLPPGERRVRSSCTATPTRHPAGARRRTHSKTRSK